MSATADRWFAEWFNEDYLKIYAHRNEGEAASLAELLRKRVPAAGNGRTLDLGCGAGRHLGHLSQQQPTIGLDLSPWLLAVARRRHPASPIVRADMRSLPFRDGAFTLVTNLFTSFGYFREDCENRHVLQEVKRVVAPGGWVVVDFLNASSVRQAIVPFDRRQVGETWVRQRRAISTDGRFIEKTITIEREQRTFMERVRLFEPRDLAAMLAGCGFDVTETFGDYQGGPLTPASPRAILLARKGD